MDITKNIEASNAWLSENRSNFKPITLERVLQRFEKKGLLSIEADAKTTKGSKNGYLTGILYLAPHSITGFNVCPMAVTCKDKCLFNAGRGRFANVTEARIIKTLMVLHDSERFKAILVRDIKSLKAKAAKKGMKPVVRLNGTSDLLIEKAFKDVLEMFTEVQFYDYTKNPFRFGKKLPANYDLTFSYDGQNDSAMEQVLALGGRVAVVFKNFLPDTFDGFEVINGDESDLRFLDRGGVVVGLIEKTTADKDPSKFVIDPEIDIRCFDLNVAI